MTPACLAAIARTLRFEGEDRTNYAEDYGGDTKWGISKRWHPEVDLDTLTREDAMAVLEASYWTPLGLDRFCPDVAAKIFDCAVLCGPSMAVRFLQRAIRACGLDCEEDGCLGPHTLAACLGIPSREILPSMRSEVAGYHRETVARDPAQSMFLQGWLRRAYS